MLTICPACSTDSLIQTDVYWGNNGKSRFTKLCCGKCGFSITIEETLETMLAEASCAINNKQENKGVTQMLQCPKCGSQNCKGNAKDCIAYCCDCGKTGEWGDFKPNTEEPKKETESGLSADQEEFLLAFDNFCKEHDIISVDVNVHGNITFEKLGYENDTLSFQRYHRHEGFDNISVVQRIDIKHFYTNPEAKKLDEEYGFTF